MLFSIPLTYESFSSHGFLVESYQDVMYGNKNDHMKLNVSGYISRDMYVVKIINTFHNMVALYIIFFILCWSRNGRGGGLG